MASYVNYHIPAGSHEISGTRFGFSKSNIKFNFKFLQNCVYDPNAVISGWNKLWGFTSLDIHGNSARFAWRIGTGNSFKLASYCYVNSQVHINEFSNSIAVDEEGYGELYWINNQYVARFKGETFSTYQPNKPSSFFTFQCYPYFGGQSVAPHDMDIMIKKL